MRSLRSPLAAAILILATTSCEKTPETLVLATSSREKTPETLVQDGYDEGAMDTAIATARAEVDEFLVVFEAGDAQDYGVKAPISDGENTEHFWLGDVTYADGAFEGTIGNEPGVVGNVRYGQRWTIKKEKISDWLYVKDGKMYGNHTLRVLLDTMPAEEAALWRSRLAE